MGQISGQKGGDNAEMTFRISLRHMPEERRILVVGCGGTGSFVAEGLCRLLINSDIPVILVDDDRVEPHNPLGSNFSPETWASLKAKFLRSAYPASMGALSHTVNIPTCTTLYIKIGGEGYIRGQLKA